MNQSLFFAFEGIDGSGKSTQIHYLSEKLKAMGLRVHETREPTDGPIGSIVHQMMTGRIQGDPRVISSLFAADRLDHLTNRVNGLCQVVEQGIAVITDRYYFSSYAYNGVEMDLDWVMECNRLSAQLLRPTLTIFLDIPVETAMARIAKNRIHRELYEKEERLRAVRAMYLEAFERTKATEAVAIIDADADAETVAQRVWDAVRKVLI